MFAGIGKFPAVSINGYNMKGTLSVILLYYPHKYRHNTYSTTYATL